MSCMVKWEIKVISLLQTTVSQHLQSLCLFSEGSFVCAFLTFTWEFMGEIQMSISSFWAAGFSNQPDNLSHIDLSSLLQTHKPHHTDPIAPTNCLEGIFKLWKYDLSKIKLFNSARNKSNSARVIGIHSVAKRYGNSKLMNGWLFSRVFLKARLFPVIYKWEILPRQRKIDHNTWTEIL